MIPPSKKVFKIEAKNYIVQLDSLRAIAVGLVIFSHWIKPENILNFFPNGMMGVTLFFVLSGYLISTILFNAKFKAEDNKQSKFFTLKSFYIRRSLRIFPIYFIVVLVLFLFKFSLVKQYPIYFFTYTHNFLYYSLNYWPGEISHLWSLAVEEQFYLIWPFIILFVDRNHILKIISLFIFLGLLTHLSLNYFYPQNSLNSVLFPTCFYAFAIGGLLAFLLITKSEILNSIYSKFIFFAALIIFLLYVFKLLDFQQEAIERFTFSILVFYLLLYFINLKGILLKIFQNKVLVYFGKVSYGIYLFHPLVNFIYIEIHKYFKYLNLKIPGTKIIFFPDISYPLMRMFFLFCLLILVSSFSWYLIEKPINQLKKNFIYNK